MKIGANELFQLNSRRWMIEKKERRERDFRRILFAKNGNFDEIWKRILGNRERMYVDSVRERR